MEDPGYMQVSPKWIMEDLGLLHAFLLLHHVQPLPFFVGRF